MWLLLFPLLEGFLKRGGLFWKTKTVVTVFCSAAGDRGRDELGEFPREVCASGSGGVSQKRRAMVPVGEVATNRRWGVNQRSVEAEPFSRFFGFPERGLQGFGGFVIENALEEGMVKARTLGIFFFFFF